MSANSNVFSLAWCLRVGLPVDTNNLQRLNDDENVGEAVRYLVMGLQHWGVEPALNFQRGGVPFEAPPTKRLHVGRVSLLAGQVHTEYGCAVAAEAQMAPAVASYSTCVSLSQAWCLPH